MSEIRLQKCFDCSWKKDESVSTETEDGFFSMRGWQAKAFEHLHSSPYMILNAPMGSGKSWMMCLLAAYKMRNAPSLRCIIAVPQTVISPGFTSAKLLLPCGAKLEWQPKHNLCESRSSLSTTRYICNWLDKETDCSKDLNDRILICTHSALVKVYEKIRQNNRVELLQQLLVWIDEAHHVKNDSGFFIDNENVNSNRLGELVACLLERNDHGIQVGLTTATFFRGDKGNLLTEKMENKFKRFHLPLDEHLQTMRHLRSFSFDFVLSGPDYIEAIEKVAKERRGKDVIHIPHPMSRHATYHKLIGTDNIIAKYQSIHGGEIINTGERILFRNEDEIRFSIVDLVDERSRDEKKSFLSSKQFKEERDAADLIIAVGMFKEGADWPWGDRSIIVGTRTSLVDVLQMAGRLFRDAKNKAHVEVVQILPFSLEQRDEERFRTHLNDYLKSVLVSLIIENMFDPIAIKIPPNQKKNSSIQKDRQANNDRSKESLLDESQNIALLQDMFHLLLNIMDTNKATETDLNLLKKEYQNQAPQILKRYGIQEQQEEVADQIWCQFSRRTFHTSNNRKTSIEEIEFDILQKTHPLGCFLRYTSEVCGIDTFQKLRMAILEKSPQDWDFYFNLLQDYVRQHGDAQVPYDYQIGSFPLGSWVSTQRKEFNSGILANERRCKLEGVTGWTWNQLEENWAQAFIILRDFAAGYGHLEVPYNYAVNGINVSSWISIQRKVYKQGKMSGDRKNQLESIPGWTWNPSDTQWEKGISALTSFCNRERHCRVPNRHREGDFALGTWVRNKKKQYIDGILPLERQKELEKFPDWNWLNDQEQIWDDCFKLLQEFVKSHGHARPPKDYKIGNFKLGTWVATQRSAYKNLHAGKTSKLTKEKIAKLEALLGWSWNTIRSRDENAFIALDSFCKRNGHVRVKTDHIENGFPLGKWISRQRLYYHKGILDEDIKSRLERYPDWFWRAHNGDWEIGKSMLLRFVEREKHAKVPNRHIEDDFTLGKWCQMYRYIFKQGKLQKDKMEFFNSLPGWIWVATTTSVIQKGPSSKANSKS